MAKMRSGPPAPSYLKKKQAYMNDLSAHFKKSMAEGDFKSALRYCREANDQVPGNVSIMSDLALVLMRTGHYSQSYDYYLKIYRLIRPAPSDTWLDGLAEVCGWLNKKDELRRYGHESLTRADDFYRHAKQYPFPTPQPPAFRQGVPVENVISFSLYGAEPKYCETLVKNIDTARELYPGWRCRVYFNSTVPEHVISRLREYGTQLVDMSAEQNIPATLWRFLVMDDPTVVRFLVRDADSLISEKEVAAVNQWLASDYWFHHMRDYFTHTELLLAGMWGGVNGVFHSVYELMTEFVNNYRGTARFTDQQFLRTILWATIRNSILNHDEIFGFHQAHPYPEHPPIRWPAEHFHIGSNAGFFTLHGPTDEHYATEQLVELVFDNQRYRYSCQVINKEWRISMPFFLVEMIKDKKMNLHLCR